MTFSLRRTTALLATSTLMSLGIFAGQAHAADQMEIMERQIHAMQAQLNALKKEHNDEIKRAKAVLARQREEAENNPYGQRSSYIGSHPDHCAAGHRWSGQWPPGVRPCRHHLLG